MSPLLLGYITYKRTRFAADRLAFRPVQHKLLIVLCAVVLLLYMTAITWLFPNPALAKFSVR
jgi:hypothetical protein